MAKKLNLIDDPDINHLIKNIVGDGGIHIVSHLFKIKKADEFEIAKKLKEDVNFIRSVMYKMYTHNLVNYTRRRDAEKGWYIYTWESAPKKLFTSLINSRQKELENLFKKVEEEKSMEQIFHCPTCLINLDFNKSLELNFNCFACGGMLQPLNNDLVINNLNEDIKCLSTNICMLKEKLNEF
jgi:transcription initiation factor TFIIE subunit alpha